jgi:hypothetical protein
MTKPAGLWRSIREWARDLAVATGIGAFLGIVGPFGSFNGGPLALRLLYWVPASWIAQIVLAVVMRVTLRAADRVGLSIWVALPAGVALGAVPLMAVILPYSLNFWPRAETGSLLDWYGRILAVAEPCAFGYYFIVGGRRLRSVPSTPAPPTVPPLPFKRAVPFVDRLPARLGRNLLCLQMEDHYVRAHTDQGSDLILTPLKDAVAELAEIDGLQVHRSWWVARRAVVAALVTGRNHSLRLSNGVTVPVSRASVARLRALGWLGPPEGSRGVTPPLAATEDAGGGRRTSTGGGEY